MNRMLVTLTEVLAVLVIEQAVLERSAEACGGTFCDSGPSSMPVPQRGENIFFVMNGTDVEAHIQIQYQGTAMRFAWVVPVPAVPEVSVGSEQLFTNLLSSTVPSYGFSTTNDCPATSCSFSGCSTGSGCGTSSSCSTTTGCTTVVYEKTVGAFDVTVLQGGTSDEVSNWLQTNGYASTTDTPSRLKPYTDKSYVFVAVRLTGSADVDQIHPLVVKYPGTMPCIPLILTAEAALDNMGIRGFFLAHGRVFPENYADVVLNDTQIDWLNLGANYDQIVSRAVDEAPEHHGFVTEFAGVSSTVSRTGIYSPAWDAMPFETIDPHEVVHELHSQGLMACPSFSDCRFEHPLLLGLLHEYLPPQGGISDSKWYRHLATETIDATKWDGAAFAKDFNERIVKPGQNAIDVLGNLPWLTRMYTTLSPDEMTADPTFNERGDLVPQSVSARHIATERVTCDNKTVMELPTSKRQVLVPGGWPKFPSPMPFTETISTVPAKGNAKVLVDNRPLIDAILTSWNAEHGWPSADSGDGGGNVSSANGSGGCACDVPGDGRGSCVPIAVAIAALEIARRRRRPHAR